MMKWSLIALLTAVCLPGIAVAIPRTMKLIKERAARVQSTRKLPPTPVLVLAQGFQTIVVSGLFALGGTWAAIHTNLGAPFFQALLSDESALGELKTQILPALGVGVAGALIFLLLFYLVFRPRLDSQTVVAMEQVRMSNGLWGRVLYGGVVEEVMFRFGFMNLLVWGFQALMGGTGWTAIWLAIVISGVLFGLGHIPSYVQAGCNRSFWFYAAEVALNLWAALIFGWLFARYGLLAAMIAHAVFHLVWYPFDRIFAESQDELIIVSES